ncbi:MAG: PAS domain S-box protein, partial [Chloroflexi bacterium]|nr:PAS domain S-box protein [Chloroflexota bacterium]
LVMGRYLDSTEVGRLSETVRLSLALQRLDEPEMPDDLKQALTTLSEDTPIFIHPLDKDLVSGYGLIEDIYGEPVLILRVDLPRAIYQQGQTSMIYFMAFMFGASVVVGTVALLLLESLILSPLSRLSSSVSRIGASGDTLARILMTGKDEMSGLANEINGMLETLKQSQEELKRSEKYFRTLIENAHDAMVIIGGDGAIAYGSPSIERMLGYKPMELIGTDGFGFAHPDDMPGVMNDFAEITKGPGATVHTELRIRHKDGSWRIVEAVATNLLENQAISGIVVNWRDVTERRRLEDDLRQSELLATTTVEGMSDGVMLVGMDGKVTYVNRAFEKMLGYSASELVGTSAVELPTYRESKDKKKAREELLKVLEKGKTDSIDMVGVTKDGIEIPISFSASVIKDNQGNPGTLVAVIRDITEHKKAEELLRYSEEYFRTLMENSLDAVTIMNEDGTIRYESPSYERLLGFKPEERVNGNLFERIHPDDIKRVAELFAEFLPDRGDVLHTEVRAQHKDGSWRSIEAMGSNLLDNPIVKGIVVNLRDVTERKRMEEALRESEERFRRLVNQAPDIIFRWSPDKGLEYVSPAVTGITGFTPGDLMADPLIGLELAKLSDSQLAEDYQRAVVERHSMRARELSFVRNDGKPVHLDIRSHAIRNEKGEVVAYEGILRDITERKEMESQLRLSEERYRLVV